MKDVTTMGRRWKRVEYERLVETGIFQSDDRIELVGGRLIVAEPKGSAHAAAVELTADALRAAFGPGWHVRVQSPIALDDESEPEPDLAVVPGSARDYTSGHPRHPFLLVEVAETSLATDRHDKASLYARALVADCWIVNLVHRVVEVYREPGRDSKAPYGWRYRSARSLSSGASLSPLARPTARVAVADFLP